MFFSVKGSVEPCGMFTIGHLILVITTAILIFVAILFSKRQKEEQVYKTIRILTIILWILEFARISFVIGIEHSTNLNEFAPLYYCSLLLYAGILSSFGRKGWKRTGDVFLATGSIVGGIIFMIFPTTSLPAYPIFHFISIHSYFFHGIMVYLGILVNITKYIELKQSDIQYYAGLVSVICAIAFALNLKCGSNLMFISQNFPGTVLEILYYGLGNFFTPFMIVIQIVGPFYFVYGILQMVKFIRIKHI